MQFPGFFLSSLLNLNVVNYVIYYAYSFNERVRCIERLNRMENCLFHVVIPQTVLLFIDRH